MQYSLADNVFARASADLTGTVCLWLGVRCSIDGTLGSPLMPARPPARPPAFQANVMLEYTYEEAEALLQKNLANAKGKMVRKDRCVLHARAHARGRLLMLARSSRRHRWK